jgi:hypothetical protein
MIVSDFDDEIRDRFLDTDWPSVHDFRAGVVLPASCLVCGDEIEAPWHRRGVS